MPDTNAARTPQQPPPVPEAARRHRTATQARALEEARVDEAVDESFPASDPPAHAIERDPV